MKKEFAGIIMQYKRNKPQHRDVITEKRPTRGLSPEDKGLGDICATKDTSLLHNGGLNDGR